MDYATKLRIMDVCRLRQSFNLSCRNCVYEGVECKERQFLEELKGNEENGKKEQEDGRKEI